LTPDYIAGLASVQDLPLTLNNPGDAHKDLYLSYIRIFQKRLTQLNTTYSLGDNLFQKFLQGTIEASEKSIFRNKF
jgi:hypothetical protein